MTEKWNKKAKKTIQSAKIAIQDVLIDFFYNRMFRHLNAESIAIDCGANMGKITLKMAQRGARVYAFEPNPHAYKFLTQQVEGYQNVTCFNKAVWIEEGKMNLYFHQEASDDGLFWSFGSSLLAGKRNVDENRYVEVEAVDLAAFIDALDAPVALLKIDVEGAECEILEKLIKTQAYQNIDLIVAETHGSKIPDQQEKTNRIKQLIAAHNIKNIKLNWL
jgi:FkbM family methyltransferase